MKYLAFVTSILFLSSAQAFLIPARGSISVTNGIAFNGSEDRRLITTVTKEDQKDPVTYDWGPQVSAADYREIENSLIVVQTALYSGESVQLRFLDRDGLRVGAQMIKRRFSPIEQDYVSAMERKLVRIQDEQQRCEQGQEEGDTRYGNARRHYADRREDRLQDLAEELKDDGYKSKTSKNFITDLDRRVNLASKDLNGCREAQSSRPQQRDGRSSQSRPTTYR